MSFRDSVVLIVRSKRPPPITTLEHFAVPKGMQCIIVTDPSVYKAHKMFYRQTPQIRVVRGVSGLSAQAAECYRVAHHAGFPWFFRLDDDLTDTYFIVKDKTHPSLAKVIRTAYRAALLLRVTMVGFVKSSNPLWLDKMYVSRVFGMCHGGAVLFSSTDAPEMYIDPALPLYDDVWQSCAHRAECGAIGRVNFIGLNLRADAPKTVTYGLGDPAKHRRARTMILRAWYDYVTCEGKMFRDNNGRLGLPFRFKRHAEYRGKI